MGEDFEIIGSNKIGFILNGKHGNCSLITLENDYSDFIYISREDYPSEKIILFPWRDEFESVKSGFFQDIPMGLMQLLSGDSKDSKNISDESILYILRYIFNKKNKVKMLVGTGHKKLMINFKNNFFPYFLTDNDKFYFFDLKHLSNPKLIEWISERDSKWKNVSIPHTNSSKNDPMKIKIKNILPQIKDELGDDYFDYEDINNWPTFKHYYEFSKIFFESRKESKQFLNFD